MDVTVRPERPVLGRAVVLAVDSPAACDVEGKAGVRPDLGRGVVKPVAPQYFTFVGGECPGTGVKGDVIEGSVPIAHSYVRGEDAGHVVGTPSAVVSVSASAISPPHSPKTGRPFAARVASCSNAGLSASESACSSGYPPGRETPSQSGKSSSVVGAKRDTSACSRSRSTVAG